jgi:hypothetical protein
MSVSEDPSTAFAHPGPSVNASDLEHLGGLPQCIPPRRGNESGGIKLFLRPSQRFSSCEASLEPWTDNTSECPLLCFACSALDAILLPDGDSL